MSLEASASGPDAGEAQESTAFPPPVRPDPSLPLGATFLDVLENVWWPLDRALDAAMLRASARLYVAEAIAGGTTSLIDHHESPSMIDGSLDVIADVCEEFAMPALLCYGATERNGGRDEARRGLAECRRFIETNTRKYVQGAVGLHAAFTVSDETIAEAGALCRELNAPLHVHAGEDRIDAHAFRRLRPALVPGSILAHGVHLSTEEVHECDALGVWLVHNPRSNRANGVGYAHVLRASERVALGTDGFRSDMLDEVAALDEVPEVIAARLEAGRRLERALFGAASPARSFASLRMTEIHIDAAAQAQRLASKLQGEPCNASR